MYLKRLELYGFKSFADKTVLEFLPGITSVIGPNGSGKSNISDAIKWVLGEQSMKSLRGAKSEDIIFAGTQNRKSLGYAECSIVFDNQDGKLPIEYAEVTVTRRIYRSGETGYFINKTPCRLKDILELFMDTGIGKDGYSIIGQGKIDEILSNKSEDRRHIFEEASGIVKYRARKQEAEKKLEQTKLNLLRINDILSEIEGKIEPLKAQSEKAKKFLDLREELKNVEVGLFIYNIEEEKQKLENIENNLNILNEQLSKEENEKEKIQELREKLKKEIEDLNIKIEEIQNIGFESTNKIERLNSQINVAKERIEVNNENYERYLKEIQELEEKTKQLLEEKEQKSSKKQNLNENKNKFEYELNKKQKELEELTSKLSEKEIKIEEQKQKVEFNTDLRYEKLNQINTQNANLENLEKRDKSIKEELSNIISELDEQRVNKLEISKTFTEIESRRQKAKNAADEIYKKKDESDKKIEKYNSIIYQTENAIRLKQSRYQFLSETEKEKEGYYKSVKSLLLDCERNTELAKGVHGVLANLLTVSKEYETAIEMSLGQSLQNIVTDTEKTAQKLIEHLRKNNLGRASFLPISSIKGKKLEKINQKNITGVIGIASDLVKYNSIYDNIILNLLGRTVVVENMDVAIALAKQNNYGFKIITLKGDVINSSGSITGGSIATKTVNILGRKEEIKYLEKQIQQEQEQLQKIKQEKQDYITSIEILLEEASGLEKQIADTEIIYATEKQKILSLEENVLKLEERRDKLKEEQQKNIEERQNINFIKQTIEKEISNIEKENEQLNKTITEFVSLNTDNQKYINDLNFNITNLKISVSSFDESQNSINEIVQRIEQEMQNNNVSINNKKQLRQSILNENEELKQTIKDKQEEIKKTEEELGNSSVTLVQLKELRTYKNDEQNKTENNQKEQEKIIDNIKQQISKIELKKSKTELEIENIINKMWEEYELTPNNATEYTKPENIQLTTQKANYLRNEIKSLGSINIDSIEEYKQTKQRYDFICEQRLDLENSSTKLKKMIAEMTANMKEQFTSQFKLINKNFKETFMQLFGGGYAELTLTDETNVLECGIEIEVQPPGKKLQNMMLLSGGEKAFTAIALLFAILKINPAPFCILDEIEAALDDVNVYRFADYLKQFAKQTQFLIITHRKGTMEVADTVYGITMEENGISKLLSMKLK